MKIEIEIGGDLVGFQFKDDNDTEEVIFFEDMTRQQQIHVINAFAQGYQLFRPALKEQEGGKQ